MIACRIAKHKILGGIKTYTPTLKTSIPSSQPWELWTEKNPSKNIFQLLQLHQVYPEPIKKN